MKIGIDARLYSETGVGRYIRNLIYYLQLIDKENEFVVFINSNDFDKLKITNERFKVIKTDIKWHTFSEQISFNGLLSRESLDLMHFPYFSLPLSYRKPFVVTIHDLILHKFETGKATTLSFPIYRIKKFGFKKVFNHALNKSKQIIVPLDIVKSDLIDSFNLKKDKIVVTNEGFDLNIKQGIRISQKVIDAVQKGKYFLYVGNAYPHKNVDFLLNSFFEFSHKDKSHRLIIVAKDDVFTDQLIVKTSSKNITFLKNVSDSDLAYLYSWAEAFVSASFMEGFGLPSLEAMANSCPLLLSDIPSFKEVCQDIPIYFDPKDKKSLIKGFQKVVALPHEEKKRKINLGLKRINDFSWENMAYKTLDIYLRNYKNK